MTRKETAALAAMLASIMSMTALADEPREVKTTITAVTVYADRAQVTRSGPVDLGAGLVSVSGLPGWIDQESVRVTLSGKTRGKILDVTTETTFLAKATEEKVRKAEEAVAEIGDQIAALNDERQVLLAEAKQLEAVRAFSLEKLPRDMATRAVKPKTFGATIDFVSDRLRKIRTAMRGVDKTIRGLRPELARRRQQRAELQTRAKLQQSRVMIGVAGAGRATLVVTYLTPGAAWEPVAELRTRGTTSATLVQHAAVIQTTGEDWVGATLSFSTQRPGETLKVPAARALLLSGSGRGLGMVVKRMGASFGRAESTYRSQNAIVSLNNKKWRHNVALQQRIQTRAVASFQRLKGRGTTAHFKARAGRTVRADGKSVRVPIADGTFAIKGRLVAVPEVSLNAVRAAELVNSNDQAILPGKVALFADGAFVGKTELPFVAPGEKFTVFLGVNDRIKLERIVDRKRSSIDRGRKRTDLKVSFLITAQNLSRTEVIIDLTDRVPAIQNEDIELDDLNIPEHAKRADNGLVRWQAKLAPGQKRTWRIEYELEYPTGLFTAEARNRRKHAPAKTGRARMLFDDIQQLETEIE